MAGEIKTARVTLEDLMVSTFAMSELGDVVDCVDTL